MQHFSGGIRRKPAESLLDTPRLYQLKKVAPSEKLIGLISLIIKDLQDFINPSRKLGADQLLDVAELILEEYEVFSIDMLVDCFNKVKASKPPFDDEVYGGLSGRKIMQWLKRYDEYMMEQLNREREEEKARTSISNVSAEYITKLAKRYKIQ